MESTCNKRTGLQVRSTAAATLHVESPNVLPHAVAPMESARQANFDLVRIVAAFAIVWFHTPGAPFKDIAYAGLVCFLLMSGALLYGTVERRSFGHFTRRRATRLLMPWLFWSVLYLGVFCVRVARGDAHLHEISWRMLLVGGRLHLWYLPFAFVLSLLIWWLSPTVRRFGILARIAAAILGASVLAIEPWLQDASTLGPPLPQWIYGMAALPLAFVLGPAVYGAKRETRHARTVAGVLVLFVATLSVRLGTTALVSYGIATGGLLAAAMLPQIQSRSMALLSSLMLGVYAIHPLTQEVLVKAGLQPTPVLLWILATFGLSVAATVLMKSVPLTARFV